MQSSVELRKSPQTLVEEPLALNLQLVRAAETRGAPVSLRRFIVLCEVIADLVTITLGVTLGYVIYDFLGIGRHVYYPIRVVAAVGFLFAIILVLMLDRVGAYRRGNSLLRVRETEQVLRVLAEAFLLVLTVSFFTSFLFSRWLLVVCLVLVPLLLFAQKSLMYLLVHALHSRGYGNEKVLIYGAGCTGRRVYSVLKRSPKLGLDPVAIVDDDQNKVGTTLFEMAYERRRSTPIIQGPVNNEMITGYGVDLVIVAIPSICREKFVRTLDEALGANVRVSFVASHLLSSDAWIDYRDLDGILLASLGKPVRRFGYELSKRLCDFVGALALTVVGSPIFLLLALIIKLDSAGPSLFCQERVGQNGKPFNMFKFRTMHVDAAPYDYSPSVPTDPRITRIGKFLRRTSLDELPQLLNVLLGQMSLVGPRPEMPFIVQQYTDRERQRLEVKPGITGLWQLSGDRAYLIHQNVEYDLYYLQHRNFFMDLAIILHTSVFAMRGI
jgi:exopolysaccharide biosynthesis polyprenyl glycosylphosphotransferase